jgi:TRAP transporter TAXI family solute receptor
MKTKWWLACILTIALIAVMVPAWAKDDTPKWPKGIICAGGTPGSGYYTVMMGVGELAKKYLDVRATIVSTPGGSSANVQMLKKGEADISLGSDVVFYWACKGIGPYEKTGRITNMRCVTHSHVTVFSWVTNAKYGIKTLADLKGSGYTIMVNPSYSSIQRMANTAALEFYGIDLKKDVKDVRASGKDEVLTALREGRAQLISTGAAATTPAPYWMEMDRDIDMRMVPLSKECIEYVCSKVKGVIPTVVPSGWYKGVPEDCPQTGIATNVFARVDLPDSLVYELCKSIYEQPSRTQWEGFGSHMKEYTVDKAQYVLTPFHAGAIKYLKEKGAWTDKLEKQQKEWLSEFGMDK